MKIANLPAQLGGPVLYGLATALAVAALDVSQGHGVFAWIAGIGMGGELAALPLLTSLSEPSPPYAVGLAGYRRPIRLPSGRNQTLIGGAVVVIMVLIILLLPPWASLVWMLIAGAALAVGFAVAWRIKRNRGAHRNRIYQAVAQHAPRFVFYTGRRGEGTYQLAMWVPILERLDLPYLVVLRHPEAVTRVRSVTDAPIVVCPAGGDLDSIMVDSLRVACYVNAVAENATFVAYRQLTHIYLGHGDSDKQLSVHPMHAMFDRVFVAGQAAIERYERAGVIIPRQRFVVVGRPQLSGTHAADRPIEAIAAPRVLYAPTWRGYNRQTSLSSLSLGPEIVSALIARGAAVTFCPHPFSWQGSQERGWVATVDHLLRRDRETSGRPHRLADECRNNHAVAEFNASDALITDIGSVLVDYFATRKPYAVVVPSSRSIDTIRTDVPSTSAAYLISAIRIDQAGTDALRGVLEDLLRADPLRDRRAEVSRYFLGAEPAGDRPFLAALRDLVCDRAGRNRADGAHPG